MVIPFPLHVCERRQRKPDRRPKQFATKMVDNAIPIRYTTLGWQRFNAVLRALNPLLLNEIDTGLQLTDQFPGDVTSLVVLQNGLEDLQELARLLAAMQVWAHSAQLRRVRDLLEVYGVKTNDARQVVQRFIDAARARLQTLADR